MIPSSGSGHLWNNTMHLFRDFIELFFPRTCCLCGRPLMVSEEEICLHCLSDLPEALNAECSNNYVVQRLQGRVPLVAATTLLIFKRKNNTQKLLHQIKYHGNERLAVIMGRQMGHALSRNRQFDDVDIIIPVPLHPRKLRKRGYNQSFLLSKGIAEVFKRPISDNNLIRTRHTETQTRKNREQRLDNMQDVFQLRDPERLKGHHVLLVDDVLTTGATTEACWLALKKVENIKISLATLSVSNDI